MRVVIGPLRPILAAVTARGGSIAVALAGVVALAACGSSAGAGDSSGGSGGGKDNLIAYSVPKPAYDALQSAFVATAAGNGVSWASSYGASGDQSRAVSNGQKADYVAFSIEPDLTRLVPEFVDRSWNSGPTKGLVSKSVVVIAVRKGNPKAIKGWDDLIKPGIKIVTPDPGSSGSAKWNILGAYSHVLQTGGTDVEAQAFLAKFFANVVAKPESGSKATQTFLNGTGDALISYENEVIAARQKGKSLDYIVPAESISIENPAAVTKTAPQSAKDFLAFAESPAGQQIFASKGLRPVLADAKVTTVPGATDPAAPFPTVSHLETIADLGGWSAVNTKFFDKKTGIVTRIEAGS